MESHTARGLIASAFLRDFRLALKPHVGLILRKHLAQKQETKLKVT